MKIQVVLYHVHRGQLPRVLPGSWKTEVVYVCAKMVIFVRCFVTSLGGRGKHLFGCISSRNKALIPAAASACLKLPVFRQVIIERWCGVFIENSLHCQKAGTFWSFEERSGSDAFILFLPSLQECLQLPSSSSQILQSTSFWSKVQSVDHISPFIALGRWRVADRALPKKALRRCIFFHGKQGGGTHEVSCGRLKFLYEEFVPRAIVPFCKTTHWKISGQKVWTFH